MTRTILGKLMWGTIVSGTLLGSALAGQSESVSFEAPGLDQWVYHRLSGSQAGSASDAAFFTKREVAGSEEDRAAAYHAAYELSGRIPSGLGSANYQIHSARLILDVVQVNPVKDSEGNITQEVVYDPTYDSWKTHLLPSDDNYATDHVADSDPGRPICLFGFGLTNGFTRFSFESNGGLATNAPLYNEFNNPMAQTVPPFSRNAFPFSFDSEGRVIAVNNNVYEGVEANPWAVASISGKNAGDVITVGDQLLFDLDVSNPKIQAYLRQSLDAGQLGLVISSLHQTPTDGFLRVATNETLEKSGARLVISYSTTPVKMATFESPDLDQWVYHRLSGSQAGSASDAAFFTKREVAGSEEDRAAAYHAAYELSGRIPPGLGAANYQIHSVRLILDVVEVNPVKDGEGNIKQEVVYDSTYDSWKTHLLPSDDNYAADHVADSDPGRPFCLFGFGLTNGFDRFSFEPNGGVATNAPYYNEFNNPMAQTVPPFSRNAFPFSFDGEGEVVAVNNNVYEGVEANPWAVASISGKNPGEPIVVGDTLDFDFKVNDPHIQAYLQRALDAGQLGLVVSSLHQTPVDGFLRAATNETLDKSGARLVIQYSTTQLRLLSLRFENNKPLLRFTGSSGQEFHIQHSGNLTDWETNTAPVLSYPADGVVEWADPGPVTGWKYYRVLMQTP